jgi:HEAT repeat protein
MADPADPAASAPSARAVPDALTRRREVIVAGHLGDPTPALAHLDDPDPTVRAAALGALERTGQLAPTHLSAALADPDPAVRRRALEAVAAVGAARLEQADAERADAEEVEARAAAGGAPRAAADEGVAIVGLLDDPDPTVVEVAAWASGERWPAEPGAVERLISLCAEADDALVREAAVAALGSLGDERGLPAVLQAMGDKATVRRRAVIALAAFEGDEVDAALERALDDRDWQVRQAAEDLRQH